MLQQEVLDHFIVFGEQHMDPIVSEAVEHYHGERPHQAKDNTLLIKSTGDGTEDEPQNQKLRLHCNERLGRLLKHYYLKAALPWVPRKLGIVVSA